MKKIICYILIYVIFCLLQFSLGKYINIRGIFPNFILILIVYLGLSKGAMSAQLAGFLLGLTWDAFSTDIFGARAMTFTIIGHFLGRLAKKFDRDKIYTQFVIVFLAGIAYLLGVGFIYYISYSYSGNNCNYNFTFFDPTVAIESLVTALVAPGVFYILDYASKDA
jgi:rod shape-determining protein MreD